MFICFEYIVYHFFAYIVYQCIGYLVYHCNNYLEYHSIDYLSKKREPFNPEFFFKNINMESFIRLLPEQKADQLLEYLNNQRKVTISDNISFRKV